jgi:hypothetical protein
VHATRANPQVAEEGHVEVTDIGLGYRTLDESIPQHAESMVGEAVGVQDMVTVHVGDMNGCRRGVIQHGCG